VTALTRPALRSFAIFVLGAVLTELGPRPAIPIIMALWAWAMPMESPVSQLTIYRSGNEGRFNLRRGCATYDSRRTDNKVEGDPMLLSFTGYRFACSLDR